MVYHKLLIVFHQFIYYNKIKWGGDMEGIKQQVIQLIQALPEGATLDDIMVELYFKMQVDAGLKELDEGKSIPHEEIEQRFSKWLTE